MRYKLRMISTSLQTAGSMCVRWKNSSEIDGKQKKYDNQEEMEWVVSGIYYGLFLAGS